jgi:hypothetical protein
MINSTIKMRENFKKFRSNGNLIRMIIEYLTPLPSNDTGAKFLAHDDYLTESLAD